jgi:hypothetical protein
MIGAELSVADLESACGLTPSVDLNHTTVLTPSTTKNAMWPRRHPIDQTLATSSLVLALLTFLWVPVHD